MKTMDLLWIQWISTNYSLFCQVKYTSWTRDAETGISIQQPQKKEETWKRLNLLLKCILFVSYL